MMNRLGPAIRATRRLYSTARQFRDVVVVGGGPAGLTLAAALKSTAATSNLSVTLIEGSNMDKIREWDPPDTMWENRVSSLTSKSVRFLQDIGAWDHARLERVKPYDEMKVWDGCSDARIEFDPFILGENSEIAYMVENVHLQQTLLKRIDEIADNAAEIRDSSLVKQISRVESRDDSGADLTGYPLVELEDGTEICARLLVGADGANSRVRQFAGITSRGWAYNRHGLVATVQLEWEDFRSVAWQRFLPTGPIALLPLPNGYATLVWSTTPERAQHLKSLSPEDFCALVDAGFRLSAVDLDYLHTVKEGVVDEVAWRTERTSIEDEDNMVPIRVAGVQDGSRASFPLSMKHSDTYISERVALVGDAGHTTHPLAGQGLNMGQSDVSSLVAALQDASIRGLDIGSPLALEPFWKAAYLSNHLKLGVFDKLHKLYSTDFGPIVALRSWGLSAVNQSSIVKRFLMHNASNF